MTDKPQRSAIGLLYELGSAPTVSAKGFGELAEHIIEAIMPTSLIAKQLKLAQFEPCLQIKRRTFSSKGVVSFATLTHPSSRFRIGGRFSVNNS